ncbi:MAG: FtsX-like permease family protein, partial [Lentimicrobiaceae bacterium]|nr:FtsX-like permease family protein [Lentimicrobiaceae bacterium]
SAGMVPLGSMFVTDAYTTSLRLESNSVISVEQGGNLNLKNEQTIPFNIFVNRAELAEVMGIPGKINVILSDRIISKEEFAVTWNYARSGLRVEPAMTVVSDRIFIQHEVVETLDDATSNRIFAYLANSIRKSNNTIPYSFVAAVDFYKGQKLNPDEIILSDYAAQRLNAGLGDTISISYFISKQFKTLIEDSVFLKVRKIVPLAEIQANPPLVAEFPGLSNVERCTDWNSDLPINMKLITEEDEAYWEQYKNTPKAIVSYAALAPRWENAYGSATALQIKNTDLLDDLTFEMFDIQLIYPRETGLSAARSGVDFSSLFFSLGFFILISAAMLMIVPLSEMLFRRRDELNLLKATGFSNKRIVRLLWRESTPVVFISAIVGVIVGLLYTYLVLFLLGNVWKGATHTDGFRVLPDFMTVFWGVILGVALSLLLLYWRIVRSLSSTQMTRMKRINADKKQKKICVNHDNPCHLRAFTPSKLIRSSILYNKKQALLSFITLACGVLIVFSVGLNRRSFADSSQIRTATGDFSLWCETSVPIYHNLQTEEGRAKLGLSDLSKETHIIQLLKYNADDASCLNLNKVVTPNVLGIDMNELKDSDFKITQIIENSVYPALVDETVLQWSLGKKLGDTLVYMGEKGDTVRIQLVGVLQNSIFQGSILIDKSLFSEIWSEISGSEIMLLKVPDDKIDETKTLILQALNNYGVRIMTTGDRLKMFYSVTDTYLTIFLTLGGLGLLLGIFSFIIVVRKNLLAREKEIALYHSLGFNEKRIFNLLYKENVIVPLAAIITGALGSLLGVSLGFGSVSVGIWGLAGVFLLTFILCVAVFVREAVKRYLIKLSTATCK